MEDLSRQLRSLVVPVLAVVLACVATLVIWPVSQPAPFAPFIAAVILGAWLGGLRGSLVTTGLSALVLIVLHALQTPGPAESAQDFTLRLVLFAFMGVAAGYLAMQCQRAIGAHDRLQHTLASAGEAWIFTDNEGRVTFLNSLAQSWTGWSLSNARMRPLEQLFVLLHEGSRDRVSLNLAEVLRQRAPQTLPPDALLLSAGGSAIPVEGAIRPIQNAEAQVVEMMLTFRDVSASRRAARELAEREARLQRFKDAAPTGLMLVDAEGRCLEANRLAQDYCGCDVAEMRGHGWTRHFQPSDRDSLLRGIDKELSSLESKGLTWTVPTVNSAGRWLELRVGALPGNRDEARMAIVVLEDVTSRVGLEKSLAESRSEADRRLAEVEALRAETKQALQVQKDSLRSQLQAAEQRVHELQHQQQLALAELEQRLAVERAMLAQLQADNAKLEARLKEKDSAIEDARRRLEDELARERTQRTQVERRLQGIEAEFGEKLKSKQAECDRTAEECLQALAELEAARRAVQAAEDLRLKVLAEQEGKHESIVHSLNAQHQAALADLQRKLEHSESSLARTITECEIQRKGCEAAEKAHASALVALRGELNQLRESFELAQHQRDQLKELLDATPIGICAHDAQQIVTLWNAAMAKLTGQSAEAMLGKKLGEGLEASDWEQSFSWWKGQTDRDQTLHGGIGRRVSGGRVWVRGASLSDNGRVIAAWEQEPIQPSRPESRRLEAQGQQSELDWLAYN